MTRIEKVIVYGLGIVIALEVLRSYTWGPKVTKTADFKPIGMNDYAGVARRA